LIVFDFGLANRQRTVFWLLLLEYRYRLLHTVVVVILTDCVNREGYPFWVGVTLGRQYCNNSVPTEVKLGRNGVLQ
jgi:hypothetical protein